MKQAALEQLIKRGLSLRNSDGSVSEHIGLADRLDYILANEFPAQWGTVGATVRPSLVFEAFATLKEAGECSIDSFKKALQDSIDFLNKSPWTKHTVVFSANVSPTELSYLNGRQIGDVVFDVMNYQTANERYALDTWQGDWEGPDDFRRYKREYSYLAIDVHAVNDSQATQTCYERYELARAMLNFALSFSRAVMAPAVQHSVISPSYLVVCFGDTPMVVKSYTSGSFNYSMAAIHPDRWRECENVLSTIQQATDGSLKSKVLSAIRLYGEALDHTYDAYRFLHLWQCMEVLVSSGEQESARERFKAIFTNNNAVHDLIDVLSKKRNDLVHKGIIGDFDWRDSYLLKNVVDQAIMLLLPFCAHVKTASELDDFWMLFARDDHALSRMKQVIEALLAVGQTP